MVSSGARRAVEAHPARPAAGGVARLLAAKSSPDRPSIIPLLQQIQEQFGYLPRQEVVRAAQACGMSLAQAYGVATFYNFFRMTPPGRHTIRVCRGTACHVRGSAALLDQLQQTLGIKAGETTPDGAFSLETVACLGCCSRAPVVVADGEIHGRLNRQGILRLVQRLRRREHVER